MDDFIPDDSLPPIPRRTVRRARALPGANLRLAWIPLGIIVLLIGFYAVRPRDPSAQTNAIAASQGQQGLADERALVGPTVTATLNDERPSLEPIAAVTNIVPPTPMPDTGLVGQPTIQSSDIPTGTPNSYTVAAGDTLSSIADRVGVPVEDLMQVNGIIDPNMLSIGQVLLLPTQVDLVVPYQRILPDSELILSPAYQDYDVAAFIQSQDGFLATYVEEVEGQQRTGTEIVRMVALRYSIGYRPLLAMLEYQSGWVTHKEPAERSYPLGERTPSRAGLFFQLSWAANRLNEGFYNQFTKRNPEVRFQDGTRALLNSDTNPGSTAIQNVFAVLNAPDAWSVALAETGFYGTYLKLFGDPWARQVPLLSADVQQPTLALPWSKEQTWYLTGGPHGGWGDYSGWAAIDFVPPDNTGCQASDYWTTAVANGKIIRSDYGEVVLDLDGDDFVGTGWTILYMHVNNAGRVGEGTEVKIGDVIGRPSCEGGVSDAAHLHIARRYNGIWIDADGGMPFIMAGWQAQKAQVTYEGFLVRGNEERETCACRENAINGVSAQ